MNLTVGVNEPLFRQILEDKDMGEALTWNLIQANILSDSTRKRRSKE